MQHIVAILAALVAALSLTPARAATCESPALPEEGGKTLWYCDTGADTVVVFVHGFNSNNRTAWLEQDPNSPSRYSFWPKIVLEDDSLEIPERSGNKPSVFLAGYYTAIDGTIFGLNDAADQLFKALAERRDGRPSVLERHDILFVAHSAGGVVVRNVLVRHAKEFEGKRLAILLVASPSKGSRYADSLAPATFASNRIVDELRVGSHYLTTLDQEFSKAIAPRGLLAELRGKEIYEHRILVGEPEPNAHWLVQLQRVIMETAAATALQERVVERSSAAVYFPDPILIPESNHSSIAHPKDVNHPSHLALREVYRQLLAARARPCDPPSHFKVVFDMASRGTGLPTEPPAAESGGPNYQLVQLDPSGEPLRSARTERDPLSGFHFVNVSEPPFACPGETYWAKLARVFPSSAKLSNRQQFTDACFRRSRIKSQEGKAFLRCAEGDTCSIDKDVPGLAEACQKQDVAVASPGLAREQGTAPTPHWVAPSLATLERQVDEVRPGYTEFTIDSEPLADLAAATHLSYAVTVNGVPIHMDGLPPHIERISFQGKGGVHLTFALENLGFTGGADGFEIIQVELRFYSGKTTIKTARLERSYVSYRHAELQRTTSEGETFEWRGYYRPARVQASYEVMLEHGGSDWIRDRRTLFDASNKTYEGLPAVGVIRPGRKENPRTGLIIGVRLANGQIRSLFNRDEADTICRWVVNGPGFDGLQRKGAYIFQFPPEAFTELRDRGRRIAHCRDL